MRSGFRRTEPEPRSGPNVLPVRVLICDGDRDRDWHDGRCWPGQPGPGNLRPRRPGAQCQRQAGFSAARRRWQCSAATALTEPGAAAAQPEKLRPKQPEPS